jgi:hypothetical protein
MVMLSACAATRHSTHVDKSGFLGEALYEKMRPGDPSKGESAALLWVDPHMTGRHPNLKGVILDHIVLYRQPQHLGGGNTNEAAQELLNYFYNKLYVELSNDMSSSTSLAQRRSAFKWPSPTMSKAGSRWT